MKHRPGVMAPPDLYDRPAEPGLMSPSPDAAEPVDPRVFLWSVAGVLAVVELFVELAVS
jgi:hypothetical protein